MSSSLNVRVINPTGILSSSTSAPLLKEFQESIESGSRDVLVDLQGVTFIDSSGLGVLVSMHSKAKLAGGNVYLCSPNDQARGIIDITDLDRIFGIFADRATFYKSLVTKGT
ncbi:MAG: STAS domain-containing protein [Leptolyngbyaceae cyanobacterium bins.59]|nr:STAS domain-containing protein [Leptolyngbyaceae cyanobacterium bins.59]